MEAEDVETGFNAANETMVNMITEGIIDPTKVINSVAVSMCPFSSLPAVVSENVLSLGLQSKECVLIFLKNLKKMLIILIFVVLLLFML